MLMNVAEVKLLWWRVYCLYCSLPSNLVQSSTEQTRLKRSDTAVKPEELFSVGFIWGDGSISVCRISPVPTLENVPYTCSLDVLLLNLQNWCENNSFKCGGFAEPFLINLNLSASLWNWAGGEERIVRTADWSVLTPGQWLVCLSVFSQLFIVEASRWEQISLFTGDVTPREEVSEEDKHKDKSSGRHLIFTADKQTAGEGFLWAADLSPLLTCILISISCYGDDVGGRKTVKEWEQALLYLFFMHESDTQRYFLMGVCS